MESLTPTPTRVDGLDPDQPTGYHGNDPQTPVHLRKRMVQVLEAFRAHEEAVRSLDAAVGMAQKGLAGRTDEELVAQVQRYAKADFWGPGVKLPSPSGIRTARKDLERAGLVEKVAELRKTALGNQAYVFRLTQAGRDFEVPQ